jgi:hypothetical protein
MKSYVITFTRTRCTRIELAFCVLKIGSIANTGNKVKQTAQMSRRTRKNYGWILYNEVEILGIRRDGVGN